MPATRDSRQQQNNEQAETNSSPGIKLIGKAAANRSADVWSAIRTSEIRLVCATLNLWFGGLLGMCLEKEK